MPEAIRSGARSPTIAALILGAVIDYFRWIQLVPMIAAWTFLLVWRLANLLHRAARTIPAGSPRQEFVAHPKKSTEHLSYGPEALTLPSLK